VLNSFPTSGGYDLSVLDVYHQTASEKLNRSILDKVL
jgi:hypothetical protein